MKTRILSITILIVFAFNICLGNDDDNPVANIDIIPPSPTAAALGAYIDFPVSHYTGIPEVQIPIYAINQKNTNIPIALSYHAKGNKVEDMASWVGLGWSLNTGGVITRSVKGLPDDYFHYVKEICNDWNLWGTNGKKDFTLDGSGNHYNDGGATYYYEKQKDEYRTGLFQGKEISEFSGSTYNEQLIKAFGNVRHEEYDLQSDVFYVNCFGFNFKFVFDKDENLYLVPQSDKQVIPSKDSNGKLIGFTIIDEGGNRYVFDKVESTLSVVRQKSPSSYYRFYTKEFNSSWYLSEFTDVSGNKVYFEYEDEQIYYINNGNRKYYYDNESCTGTEPTSYWRSKSSMVYTTVQTKKLGTISWNGGTASFERGHNRLDLTGGRALTSIEIYDPANNFVKGFNLLYSYFITEGSTDISGKRLKLDAVQQYSNSSTIPPYRFYYNSKMLPERLSDKVDFWGFYNSNAYTSKTKTYYYPDYFDQTLKSRHCIFPLKTYTGQEQVFDGADRNSNETDMKACILEKIEYPTGGYTQFEYGCHEFENPFGLFDLGDNITGGGIRIEAVYHSADGNQVQTKNYYYTQLADNSLSSGKLIHLPQFASTYHKGCWRDFPYNISFDSQSLSGLGRTHESHVGYSEVTVAMEGNGHTCYKYKTPGTFGVDEDVLVSGNPVYQRTIMKTITDAGGDITVFEETGISYPYPPNPNLDWYRGLLEEVTVYDNSSKKVQRTEYRYDIKSYTLIPSVYSTLSDFVAIAPPDASSPQIRDFWYLFANYDIISPWVVQSGITEYTFDSQDETKYISKTTDYIYNSSSHKQLTSKSFTGSDGKENKTEYRYADSFSNNLLMKSMAHPYNNIKNQPIEIIHYEDGKVTDVTVSQFNCYGCNMHQAGVLVGGSFLVDNVYKLESNLPLLDYQPVTTDFTIDSRCKQEININSYDSYGNPTSITTTDGLTTTYTYAHNGQYPESKTITGTDNNTSLTESWTWKPLIGIETHTDQAGLTTTYEHDDFQRLETVKDNDGNIISHYEYNYAPKPVFYLASSNNKVVFDAATSTIELKAYKNDINSISFSKNASWINYTTVNDTTSEIVFEITVNSNLTTSRRDGILTLTALGNGQTFTETINIEQIGIGLTGNYKEAESYSCGKTGNLTCYNYPTKYTQLDETINFNWGTGSPSNITTDRFRVYWEGYIVPQSTGLYTFHTEDCGSSFLYIGEGDYLIYNSDCGEESESMYLEAGKKYLFRYSYTTQTWNDNHFAKLKWTHGSVFKQVIAKEYFRYE